MPRLQVKTRGGSAHVGKPKIYFCCHPDDHDLYFDEICNDVLGLVNCAIYYKTEADSITDEDMLFNLQQMNLFVIPITSSLLSSECPALSVDVPFAQSQHIPLLPIMQEPGLYQPFTKAFGKLQYLKRYETDPTEIPYKEKLDSFLSAVVVSGELAEKVRAAFDAYIFLSYRKKDRRCAQRLMELIHSNDFCRDVAIWYDEYLTPGENFNELISRALDKSELFVLAVTPNLVNEVNYIMNVEYPMAQERKKPILPVEMAETDRDELRSSFSSIPDPVNAEDADSLKSSLLQKLDQIKMSEGNDPGHRFFIGLAYLQGIDVEKNVDRALSMISEAAQYGLPEALEKLSTMYYYGEGVRQDYGEALDWQDRLADKFEETAEESGSDQDTMAFLEQRMKYGDMAFDCEYYLEAADAFENAYGAAKRLALGIQGTGVLKKIVGFAKRFSTKTDYLYEAFYLLARSARKAMQSYEKAGLVDDAAKWGKRAIAFSKSNAMFQGEERSARELAAAYGTMGMLCLDSGNIAGAREAFACEISSIPEGNDRTAALMDIHANTHFGSLEEAEGNIRDAAAYYDYAIGKAHSLYAEFKAEPEGWSLLPELFSLYARMSLLCQRTKAFGDAGAVLRDASELIESENACASEEMLEYYRNVIKAHKGSILLECGKPDEARELLSEASTSLLFFAKERSISFDSINHAAFACELLGDCFATLGEAERAAGWQEKACDCLHDNMALTKSIKATKLAAAGFEKLVDRYLHLHEPNLARQWYDKAEWCLNVVAVSTNLASDISRLEELRRRKPLLDSELDIQPQFANNRESLLQYVVAHDDQVDILYPDCSRELEINIGKLMVDFCKSHPLFKASPDILNLGRALLKKNDYEQAFNPLELLNAGIPIHMALSPEPLDYQRLLLPGRIAKSLLDASNPFLEYDEQAGLILSYCGFCDLASSKHVIGGKDKAFADFESFFSSRPFWDFPLTKVTYKEQWLLLFHMIKHR